MEINDQATLQQYIDNTPDSHFMPLLAALYLADNEIQPAIDLCRQDLTIHPYSSIAHFVWALAAEALDDIDQTVVHLQSAVQTDACFLQAYYKLIELSQGYLTPQQLKHCYEQVCRLNPFDTEIVTKLAAMPADLDMLSAQMKIKPLHSPKAQPPAKPGPESDSVQSVTELPAESISQSEPVRPPIIPVIEADLADGARHLSKFFNSIKQATDLPAQPPIPSQPSFPEEEAHLGPVEMPEPPAEPMISFDEPETITPPVETAPESAEGSSISDLFSRLREKPLEDLQKENWMAEHATSAIPEESPALSKVLEKTIEPEKPAESQPEKPADILTDKLADLVTAKPEAIEEDTVSNEAANADALSEPVDMEELPTETAVAPPEPEAVTPPKKRPSRSTKKNDKPANNISFPIPTWTLVDVLTKQKLFEQALSILDIIEAKSKNEKDLEKVQASRVEIIKLMAEEQSGEA